MIIKVNLPDVFVPEQIEFQMYCAIKLLKRKYISKEEAMKMCGFSDINETNNRKFDELLILFERRYKKLCGDGYADGEFIDDIKNVKK